jgi:hypothetical protein
LHDVVDTLVDVGWSEVGVGGRLTERETDRGLVDVNGVLTRAGYVGTTPRNRTYHRIDLSRRTVDAPCPDTSLLAGERVSAAWVQAGLRLVLARWSQDDEDLFRGAVSALPSCAATIRGAATADVAAEIVTHLPPAFSIVEVCDGDDSARLIASRSVVLTDVVTAVLWGTDPAASRVVEACLRSEGLPVDYYIEGDIEPLAPRRTQTRLTSDALRQLNDRLPAVARTMRVLMSDDGGDRDDVDQVLGWLQRTIGPLVQPDSQSRPLAVGTIGYSMATMAESVSAWRANFAKDDVRRMQVPLGFDAGRYRSADYRAIPTYIKRFTSLLDAAGNEDSWLRWCYFDGAVLFAVHRVVNAPYSAFVARVDVAEGISMMADYLGGRRAVVSRDDHGRAVMQAERNIYLPQPNYLAFWGGKVIDVCKIELVEYTAGLNRLHWKTVGSPNDSAIYDDGQLTFSDNGDERTRITISGRQQFRLPLFWQAVDLDRYPAVKNELVTDAYRRFFSATFDNFEACYEGRPYRIGADAAPSTSALPTEALSTYLDIAREWLADQGAQQRSPYQVDEEGFRHFRPPTAEKSTVDVGRWSRTAERFAREYLLAVRNDAARGPRW